jgi:HK97 family phage prohead protease
LDYNNTPTGDLMMKTYTNKDSQKGFFKTYLPLVMKEGTIQVFEKTLQDGTKRKFLKGIASNTKVDKDDEVISSAFIEKMKSSAMGLTVFAEHERVIDKTLGYVEEVYGSEGEFGVVVALEPEEENQLVGKILKKMEHGIKLGFSIGGKVTKAIKKYVSEVKKTITELVDGEIYEVSLTAMPANYDTWAVAMTKSIKEIVGTMNGESSAEDITEISKALDEMMEASDINEQIYSLLDEYRWAVSSIIYNDELMPEQKKEKINNLSGEFSDKVELLSIRLTEIIEVIDEAIN